MVLNLIFVGFRIQKESGFNQTPDVTEDIRKGDNGSQNLMPLLFGSVNLLGVFMRHV